MRVLALFREILEKCASNTELMIVLLHPWHPIDFADDQAGNQPGQVLIELRGKSENVRSHLRPADSEKEACRV